MALLGNREYYQGIGDIIYEGKESDNPLAYKYYNPEQIVAGKTMRDQFRFAVAYWHTFCGQGSDPFGPGTQHFPWDQPKDPMDAAAREHNIFHGTNPKILWTRQRQKQMQLLNSLPNWASIISVFTILTLFKKVLV
jgi:hypothetical protein